MCYINGIRVSLEEYLRYKQHQQELTLLGGGVLRPVQRGFDYSDWPVIKPLGNGDSWTIEMMEWGFLPAGIRTDAEADQFRKGYKNAEGKFIPGFTTLNAVGEEILWPGKMFRDAALHRRCLVLSSGFFEHRQVYGTNQRTGKPLKTPVKYPYHICVPEMPVFFMAGIYQAHVNQDTGEMKNCFAIVTTEANTLMKQIHNCKERMPVIFDEAAAEEWTNADLTEERIKALAKFRFPATKMKAVTVSKNFFTAEKPEEEFIYPDLPALDPLC